jgi:ATP-dependent exoDNAse (exonuclease V) alpha subunit
MAIFHLSKKIISRSEGRSAVACASYRAGEKLHDERLGRSFRFKREDRVEASWITAPANAKWAEDRSLLWNSLEAVEKRKDAQLASELTVALPHELPRRLQKELLVGFVDEHFTKKGLVVDVNLHTVPIGQPYNDHAHLMSPLRAIDPETGGWKKTKDRSFFDKKVEIADLRASWAKHVNSALEKAECSERVDHRSNKDRGIDELPTVHEGYAAQGIEARGGRSWRMALNRQIREKNLFLVDLKARAAATVGQFARKLGTTLGLELSPAAQAPSSKKKEPAPAPIEVKPAQANPPPGMPPPKIIDAEAEKRKKAAHQAAMRHFQGGGVGG